VGMKIVKNRKLKKQIAIINANEIE